MTFLSLRDVLQEQVDHSFGGDEGADLVVEDLPLGAGKYALDRGIVVERVAQRVVDALVHPVLRLLVAFVVEVAVLFRERDIFVDHVPYLLDADVEITGIGQYLRIPARFRGWE